MGRMTTLKKPTLESPRPPPPQGEGSLRANPTWSDLAPFDGRECTTARPDVHRLGADETIVGELL